MIKVEHKPQVFKLWDTDGYRENTLAYFSNEADAKSVSRKHNGGQDFGYYGVTGMYLPSFIVFESVAEYEGYKTQSVRDAALKKLTLQEKQALGLV